MIGFAKRNLKVFFKDKASVMFSLLAVFIIIGLYALFLGDAWEASFEGLTGVEFLMNSWIMGGLLAVISVTTTMGAFGTMVTDRENKISKDFSASPLKRGSLVGGYILSAIIIGIIISLVALVVAEIYIVSSGGELLGLTAILKTLGLIVLSTFASSSMVLFLVSFLKSSSAFSTASIVLGTIIGFLTGIYLPVGNLPEGVQMVVKCFPVSHAAALLRQTFMEVPVAATFSAAPAEAVGDFEQFMGVTIKFGDTVVTPLVSIIILLITGTVFYGLSVLNLSRKNKG